MSSQVLPVSSRLATSAVVTSVDKGLRSSWLASEKNARWVVSECSSLSSISFIVTASAAISSPVGGTSTRPLQPADRRSLPPADGYVPLS